MVSAYLFSTHQLMLFLYRLYCYFTYTHSNFVMGVYSNSYCTTNLMYQILHGLTVHVSLYWSCMCVFVFECQCQHAPMFVTTSASSRAREALRQCLPDQLKDATLSMYLKDENTKKWLSQLMQNLSETV